MSAYTSRRDRGVALPSPVAAISIVAIVVAAITFAVTGFGPSKSKVIPNAAPTTHISSTASATARATQTSTHAPPVATFDKSKLHVSVFNAGTVKGLAADTAAKVKAAGWPDSAFSRTRLSGSYATNAIYYPTRLTDPAQNAMWKAAATQLGLDLGIPAAHISGGDSGTRQDRLTVVMVTPLH